MRRMLLVAVILTAMMATTAAATAPPVQWFSDNFEGAADNTRLRVWWGSTLTGPENYIRNGGFGYNPTKAARLKGSSSSGASSSADKAVTATAGVLQVLHFTLQSDLGYQLQTGYNHAYVKLLDTTGADLGYWYGHSSGMTARIGGNVIAGSTVSLLDGSAHDFDVVYDPLSGVTSWFGDGAFKGSYAGTAGQTAGKVYVQDTHRLDDFGVAVNDWIWLDDVVVGTVPEPSSLLALGALGLGMLGYIKRRGA